MGCGCNSGFASNSFFIILILFILLAIIFGACGCGGW
ncbi:MAG: sporulation protein YjcZ [Bacilli bacterium]|nr:sporulation protein YjcZ [Bacilli bacterium]